MSFHMRRRDKEITDPRISKKILATAKYVTIALSMDDQPYLVSLSHGYDEKENCLYFHCAKEGKKLHYLRANNNIWGQALVDFGYYEGQCTHLYATVQFSGKVALIEDVNEKRRAIECMIRQIDKNPEKLLTDLNEDRLKDATIGRINLQYISGKKSKEVTI